MKVDNRWNYKTSVWTPHDRKRKIGGLGLRQRDDIVNKVGTELNFNDKELESGEKDRSGLRPTIDAKVIKQ